MSEVKTAKKEYLRIQRSKSERRSRRLAGIAARKQAALDSALSFLNKEATPTSSNLPQ